MDKGAPDKENYVKDRVVIVTGWSSGFGLESAGLLLEMAAKVVITGRDAARLKKAEADLGKGGNVLAVRADAVRTPDWKRLIDTTVKTFGCLDVLINNHGAGGKIAEVENMDDASIGETIDVNLSGVIKGCREAVRAMKPRGKELIVNVSSACARHAWLEGYPGAAEFARSLVHCVDVPDNCVMEELNIWGTRRIKDMMTAL
jgi:NAD(P)-dependent dehydrogenase (short-subunit alcohol dehydrogenase family)